MILPRACFLVVLTFVSIELKPTDATLVDLLNDVKNKLEEIHVEEEKLQNEMQKETESLAKNGIKMNGIKEKVQDIDETVNLVLHHVAVNSGTLGMVEKDFVGGTPRASSEWSGCGGCSPAAYAFEQNPQGYGGWTSDSITNSGSPPEYVWYDFKRQLLPAKISYLPRKSSVGNASFVRVKRFQFVGTNDPVCSKNSDWKVLCGGESAPYKSLDDERGCTVPAEQYMGTFHCLGLRSLVTSDTGTGEVSLRGIRIWTYQ